MIPLVILIVLVVLFYRVFIYKKPEHITTVTDVTSYARAEAGTETYVPDDIFGKWLSGTVTSVMDGDGFRFDCVPSSRSSHYTYPNLIIRLAGIDAPELGSHNIPAQPFAKEARNHLKYLVLGKEVRLKLIKRDMYGRLLAICRVGNNIINLEMVRVGLACVYRGYGGEYNGIFQDLKAAEANAKYQRLGMWIQDDYVSPRSHKRGYRIMRI